MSNDQKQSTLDTIKVSAISGLASAIVVVAAATAFFYFAPRVDPEPTPAPLPIVEQDIEGPRQIDVGGMAMLTANKTVADPQWRIHPPTEFFIVNDGKSLIVSGKTAGQYWIVSAGVRDGKTWLAEHLLTVQGPQPPPDPDPDPDPDPKPDPDPIPPPLPGVGLRVLIVEESSERSALPPAQLTAMFSPQVRDYLNRKTAKGTNNVPEWRIFDPDTKIDLETQVWKDAMKLPRQSLPWIIISDGKTGFSGPLPANETALLDLLKKYGGA